MQLSCPASASSCTQRENDFSYWDNLWPDASGGLQNHRGWMVANSAVAYPTVAYPAVTFRLTRAILWRNSIESGGRIRVYMSLSQCFSP